MTFTIKNLGTRALLATTAFCAVVAFATPEASANGLLGGGNGGILSSAMGGNNAGNTNTNNNNGTSSTTNRNVGLGGALSNTLNSQSSSTSDNNGHSSAGSSALNSAAGLGANATKTSTSGNGATNRARSTDLYGDGMISLDHQGMRSGNHGQRAHQASLDAASGSTVILNSQKTSASDGSGHSSARQATLNADHSVNISGSRASNTDDGSRTRNGSLDVSTGLSIDAQSSRSNGTNQ
ncbi:MAG: hypothetical protein JWO78_525 [Micavibrio sp.]|nr:hypothetical protein [Micavibrio sp.]